MSGWRCERDGADALRDPVTIERIKPAATANGMGEVDQDSADSWETYFSPWAEIRPRDGSESGQPTQQVGLQAWALRVRYCSETAAITPLMRVRLADGSLLNVVSVVDPDRRQRWIEIVARERTT